MIEFKKPICVAAHDAGAANIIAGIIEKIPSEALTLSVDGAAIKIFENYFPNLKNVDLSLAIAGANTLLSGTSGTSNHEHHARKLAKQAGIESIAVVDHWVNYSLRFERNGAIVLPDEIWVTDEYAKKIAENEFLQTPIVQIPNHYLESALLKIAPVSPTKNSFKILYILEPITQKWGNSGVLGEFQALNYFLESVPILFSNQNIEVILRPHPSEKPEKYKDWVDSLPPKYSNGKHTLNVRIDHYQSLTDLISWSQIVLGCESYALVIALLSGRRTISSIPPNTQRCRLPHAGIEHLSALLAKKK